ncbi:MAG: IS607 family transposase [Actinobacteria bacterium]|nr:IS607 family transposase [Actinomycetota bacterium]
MIIKDIGSGLNFKRKGFQTILDTAIKGNLGEIVVTHKDRLCRFGFELLEAVISKCSNGTIVVLDQRETSPQEELINDLLSIITVFSSRLYGLRSHTIKKQIQDTIKEKCQSQDIKGSFSPNKGTERATPIDDGTISMVL